MNLELSNTLFCNKIPKKEMNELLNIIIDRLERFVNNYGYAPTNILLNPYDYMRIIEKRPDLLKKFDGYDYILCMKIDWRR